MTIYEFISMFMEEDRQYFELWDNEEGEIIFKGYLSDLTEDLEYAEISSIDNIYSEVNGYGRNTLTLNIN